METIGPKDAPDRAGLYWPPGTSWSQDPRRGGWNQFARK